MVVTVAPNATNILQYVFRLMFFF